MGNIKLITAFVISIILGTSTLYSADFIDSSAPSQLVGIGLRRGINKSSTGINYHNIFSDLEIGTKSWETGFDAGAVVNLNLREFFTIQPGFFFQNKSFDSMLVMSVPSSTSFACRMTHSRYYYFSIPVMMSFRFNLSNNLKLLTEVGPYFSFGMGGDTDFKEYASIDQTGNISQQFTVDYFGDSNMKYVQMKKYDWGFKMGVGLMLWNRYSFGIYYNAGCRNIANDNDAYMHRASAKNKQWTFTLGYDF